MNDQAVSPARLAFTTPAGFFALGFGSGLAPWAPGTVGTLAAVPIALATIGAFSPSPAEAQSFWHGDKITDLPEEMEERFRRAGLTHILVASGTQVSLLIVLLALLYAAVAFVLILLVDFRSIKTTLIAMTPLVVSLLLMLGIMGATGFPFSVVNVIGLPLILGIGIVYNRLRLRHTRRGKTG